FIVPLGWPPLEFPFAFLPHRCRRFHLQRFVGSHMIVFVTKFVQPSLPLRRRRPSAPSRGSLQGPMKAFHLALCLRMSVSAEIKSNALLHQPHRQPCPSADRFTAGPCRSSARTNPSRNRIR